MEVNGTVTNLYISEYKSVAADTASDALRYLSKHTHMYKIISIKESFVVHVFFKK